MEKEKTVSGYTFLVIVTFLFVVVVLALIVFRPGETQPDRSTLQSPPETEQKVAAKMDTAENMTSEMMESSGGSFRGVVLAGKEAPLLDFNEMDYEEAINSDKLVVLYFFANWCPTCKKENAEALLPAFNELQNDKVVGFRVNYKDNQTDKKEEELAREFGVAYQHTKVFLKNGQRVLKAPDTWGKQKYLEEIQKNIDET